MSQSDILTKLIQDEKYTEIINSGIKNVAFDMTNNPNAKTIFTNSKLVKYFIDNNIDIILTYNNWKLIHYVCRYSINSPEGINIIKYIIDMYLEKNYKIDYITNDGWAPIHFICRYAPNTPEGIGLVKYIFNIYKEHNLDEKQKTYQQLTPMWYYEMSDKSVFDLLDIQQD